jgi:hypothetical protein
VKALAVGVVLLAALDLALTSRADQIGGLLGTVAGWLARWMDPAVPLIGAAAPAPVSATSPGGGGTPLTVPPGTTVPAARAARAMTTGGKV